MYLCIYVSSDSWVMRSRLLTLAALLLQQHQQQQQHQEQHQEQQQNLRQQQRLWMRTACVSVLLLPPHAPQSTLFKIL
jgi:hypothetical protein